MISKILSMLSMIVLCFSSRSPFALSICSFAFEFAILIALKLLIDPYIVSSSDLIELTSTFSLLPEVIEICSASCLANTQATLSAVSSSALSLSTTTAI